MALFFDTGNLFALLTSLKTDTICQPALQRQLWVTMSSGSYVEGVFLFKQKVVSQNNDLYRDTTQQTFLS